MITKKKKITLIGANGVIGKILSSGLTDYELTLLDLNKSTKQNIFYTDIKDYNQLQQTIPEDTEVLIDLTALPEIPKSLELIQFNEMNELYIKGLQNVLEVVKIKKIPKFIYSSSNHVMGKYENNGYSLLNREITENDYPNPDSVYGAMKLFGENLVKLYSEEVGFKAICFRIGTVIGQSKEKLDLSRTHRTILKENDLVEIYKSALESEITYGVYNAVSNNTDKPWSIQKLLTELQPKIIQT